MVRPSGLIVIPAYNEQQTIEKVILGCLKLKNWDVLVVDDASKDETGRIVKKHPIHIIENYQNLGYEKSINIGYEFAVKKNYNYLSFIDADGEHNPKCLKDFDFKNEKLYIKIGIRSWYNRPSENIAAFLSKYMYGIKDPYCGLKSYNLKALKNTKIKSLPGDKIGTGFAREVIKKYGKKYIQNIKIDGVPRRGDSRFSKKFISTNLRLIKNVLF